MAEKQWLLFFREEASRSLEHGFTKNTLAEVGFLIQELGLPPGQRALDIGCGTGRHSLELARRGYRCTGIDQSEPMLEIGRRVAEAERLPVVFVQGDAAQTRLPEPPDHAICLCEAALSLLEHGVDPVAYHLGVLRNSRAMLKGGGRFLLTALNALGLIREHGDADVASGHLDLLSTSVREKHVTAAGTEVELIEKGFMPAELTGLLETSGVEVLSVWGGTAGSWNKGPILLDEIEIMVSARAGGTQCGGPPRGRRSIPKPGVDAEGAEEAA